ncbi:hypothetical protein [Actinoplanes sp. RD1]|nr:hypothetical protein [Actinoplanes sp. RD1]
MFRALHRTGLQRVFIDHQRLVPLVATPGNTGVTFAALSYAGA